MSETLLKNNERLVQEWRPDFRIFLRKVFGLGLLTTVLVAAICFAFGALLWMLTLPLFLVAFMFDDYREWRQRRHDRWLLTNQRLIFINSDEESETQSLDLQQISGISQWMWWALRLRLANGQTIMLMFLTQMDDVTAAISSARDQITGESHA